MPYMETFNSLYAVLRHEANKKPDQEFLRISDERFTYGESLKLVENSARSLRELGIVVGDRVGIMSENRSELVWAWLGTNAAGAIDVPFNAEARGRLLAYFVDDAEPRVLMGTIDYLKIMAETIETDPEFVICLDGGDEKPFGPRAKQLSFEEFMALGVNSDIELVEPSAGQIATIMYTSGTTGPSKGVMLPQRYYPAQGEASLRVIKHADDEVSYCAQPLFHIDARAFLSASLCNGTTQVLSTRFSVSKFWDEIREHNATSFATIGTMIWLLYKQPEQPDDKTIPATRAICSSTPREILRDFEKRFDIRLVEGYGMTECVLLTAVPADETQPGRIGKALPELEFRLVDDEDFPVPAGEIGEFIFRLSQPFAMMQGYWKKPEATVEAWRNLWFHTGDLMRQHPDGFLEYIGRKKDSIRRRGENISAWEVEQAFTLHPSVLEVAAIGVPSDLGEEDLAVIIVRSPNADSATPEELVEFVSRDLPRFAVPRYIEFVDSLPKTPSERIEKGRVKERGITSAAWDANVALGRR